MGGGGVRIEQGEHNEVELVVAVLDIVASIIEDDVYAWGLIRMLGMEFAAELNNDGINVDRGHAPGTIAERGSYVVAHTRSKYKDRRWRRVEAVGHVVGVPLKWRVPELIRMRLSEFR